MAVEVRTLFAGEDTVEIWGYVRNHAGAWVDPTAITVDIIDPDGTVQVNDEAMTKDDVGKYYYQYHQGASEAAMASGHWRGRVKVRDGSGDTAILSTQNFGFRVK